MRLGLHSIFLSLFIAASSLCAQAEMVVSHKTAGLEYPENTYEGFLASLAMPVDAIEIDLHVTKDQQLVLHHGPVLSSYNCLEKTSQQRVVTSQTSISDFLALKCFNYKVDLAHRLSKFSDVLDADQINQHYY
jgi:glycerophosphoryl diester phosphodiesterase